MPFRIVRSPLLPLCLLATPLGAGEFVTSKGETVTMHRVETMTCEQIETSLAEIDSTRYRENAPTNHDPADDSLFAYEQDLAHALFRLCVIARRPLPETETATAAEAQASNR